MPIYRIEGPHGPSIRPCPQVQPEPGQTYRVARCFTTRANFRYFDGDELTLVAKTNESSDGYTSSLGNWLVKCPFRESVWSEIEGMIASGILLLKPDRGTGTAEEILADIFSIMDGYREEMGWFFPTDLSNLKGRVSELVDSHRRIRDNFRSVYGEYQDARKQGYADGLKMGGKAADSQYISLDSLRAMSLGELSNLLYQGD